MKIVFKIIFGIGAIILFLALMGYLFGDCFMEPEQYGMVWVDKEDNICSIMSIKPYDKEISPYTHYLQNPTLYKTINCRKCKWAW